MIFSRTGQSLVEIIIAMGLSAIILPTVYLGLMTVRENKAQSVQRAEAAAQMRELTEATRQVQIREHGWLDYFAVANGAVFHPAIDTDSSWILASGTDVVSGYTRSITFFDVYRDFTLPDKPVVETGGTLDPSTKRIVYRVAWNTPLPSFITSTQYLTRYMDNLSQTYTTYTEFDAGTKSGISVNHTTPPLVPDDGDITLGGGGSGDWCQPDLTLAQVDLPKSGVANALTVIPASGTSPGYAFAGTGENASGVSFAKVVITDTDPPAASIPTPGTFNGYKTNGVFGEENYAYLATDNNTKEIVIIDLQTDPFSESGWFNAPGNGNGDSIWVNGSTGYMTSGDKFYTINLTGKSGDRGLPVNNDHIITLAGTGRRIRVKENTADGKIYAYVAVDSASTQLEIIDVTDPVFPVRVGWANSVNNQGATDIFVNETSTRAYLVTTVSAANPEFFIFDVSDKTGNHTSIAGQDLGGMSPKGVVAVTNNKVITVGTGGIEYQVFNYDDSTRLISSCGSLNIDIGVNGIDTVIQPSGNAFSYIITGDASTEFKVIRGGPSGVMGVSGDYESPVYDIGSSTAFNRLSYTASLVPGVTSITFQFAAADPVGDCAGANYVYRDIDTSGVIPLDDDNAGYENPARCFRYRIHLATTDRNQSPILFDVTFNYSP
jgi:hypothetical protein